MPLAFVAAIPPSVASAPGSTGKKSPNWPAAAFSAERGTPACTSACRSSARTSRIRVIRVRSRLIPPRSGIVFPSRLVPAPNGVTAIPRSFAKRSTAATSSVVSAKTTASGSCAAW